jgi:hypothetical protein
VNPSQRLLAEAMAGADYVQVDELVFETGYVREPDEAMVAEDVVMELKLGKEELAFTREELDDARYLGDGTYRLKSGALLRFLTGVTLH